MALQVGRYRILALLVLAAATACQTTDDVATTNNWTPAPSPRTSESRERTAAIGAPLFANSRAGASTILEGSGRFVGEPPTGAVRASGEAGEGGVTLNLVNVPAPQAAKTVLGDIPVSRFRSS